MTKDTRHFDMGDPAKALERKQEPQRRSCAGCREIRIRIDPFDGRHVLHCQLGNKVGQRCRDYQERNQ